MNATWKVLAVISLLVLLPGCSQKEEDLGLEEFVDKTAESGAGGTGAAAAATATLKGKVTLEGAAPAAEKVSMDADPACKAKHEGGVVSDTCVVGPDGGLRYVFVYVKEGIEGNYPAPKEPVVFDQRGCMYSPHVFGMQTGQPIKILNSDDTLHNVHALPKEGPQFNLAMPFKGMELTKKFTNPEIMVKFKCDVHPWMAAYCGVLNHPFFAVSEADGTFHLPTLPPGTYTIEAWHEKFGTQSQNVTLGDKETKEISFTFQAKLPISMASG